MSARPFRRSPRDWRIWFGMISTALWISLGLVYIFGIVGWRAFVSAPAEALGGFLEGAFAPLAFLWLVIGFFLQQRELALNTRAIQMQYEEMRRTAEQAEIQAKAISSNELHTRQETFLKVSEIVSRQLGVIAGFLYLSSQGPAGDGPVGLDELGELWARLGQGDSETFRRLMMQLHVIRNAQGKSAHDLFYGTEIRARHCQNFIATFERLLRSAGQCDPDGMVRDALDGSAHGVLHRIMCEYRDEGAAASRTVEPR
jgi:hypothetical protein